MGIQTWRSAEQGKALREIARVLVLLAERVERLEPSVAQPLINPVEEKAMTKVLNWTSDGHRKSHTVTRGSVGPETYAEFTARAEAEFAAKLEEFPEDP